MWKTGKSAAVMSDEHDEGFTTKMIESQTARVPSGTFLTAGIVAIGLSWLFLAGGRRNIANFIGLWVPTILIMGVYNKLVKLEGSD